MNYLAPTATAYPWILLSTEPQMHSLLKHFHSSYLTGLKEHLVKDLFNYRLDF